MPPTKVPATKERASVNGQSTLQLFMTGSYSSVWALAHGSAMKGLPPPHVYNRPELTPLPGTLVSCGIGAPLLHASSWMLYLQASAITWFWPSRPPTT